MARARNIKPDFFKNEQLADCAVEANLLFAGLWCQADREGRLEDRPRRLKAEIFPLRDEVTSADVDRYLGQLAGQGLIVRYHVDGLRLIWIPNFAKHQRPHHAEVASQLPAYSPSDANVGESQTRAATNLGESQTRAKRSDPLNLIPDSRSLIPEEERAEPAAKRGPTVRRESPLPMPSGVLDTPEFHSAWSRWIQHRKEIKHPLRPQMASGQLRECEEMGVARAVAMIDHTITKGWQGLRESDDAGNRNATGPKTANGFSFAGNDLGEP